MSESAPAEIPVSTLGGAEAEERSVDPPPPDPDQLLPAESICTHRRDEAVQLRITSGGPASIKPMSVPSLLVNTVRTHANDIALVAKRNGNYQKWTYAQYFHDIKRAARSFIKLGLEVSHGVCIIGFNSPEWFIADLAAIVSGGLAVGVYATNNAEACHYVADDCEAQIAVVENDIQLQKFLEIRDRLPHLKAIIQYTGTLSNRYSNVYAWDEFMDLGKDVSEEQLIARIRLQAPNKCCTLIYTSGTTGPPKGVMLSHDNITWTTCRLGEFCGMKHGEDLIISYLPLSHIAAQIMDIFAPLVHGATVFFAQPDALKGSLGATLKEVRPTFFFGVPRVWEKMEAAIKEKAANNKGLKKAIGDWAKGIGLKYFKNVQVRQGKPMGYGIANSLVFSKVLKEVGLDRAKCFTGAAPISPDTLYYLASIGINIVEIFGMSECSGPHTVGMFPDRFRTGSTGVDLPGCHTHIDKPDKDGNGELCLNGRHVFMGYLNKPEKTRETISVTTGWMRTGDVARVENDFLYITGRIKEILITAGGENVAPVVIEDAIKRELPVVSNAMVIGDRMKFLSCLLTLKTSMNPDTGEPGDDLTPEAVDWCRKVGCQATILSEILDCHDANVMTAIQSGIDRANEQAISRAQKIQKWTILPRDFSMFHGELGPTLKLKRQEVSKMYQKTIHTFYGD